MWLFPFLARPGGLVAGKRRRGEGEEGGEEETPEKRVRTKNKHTERLGEFGIKSV